jgi:hypothetical protein
MRGTVISATPWTLLLTLAATTAWSAEPISAWGSGRVKVQAKHLVPAMKGGEGYGEKWTFDGKFGERGSLYYSLAISNLGIGDHKMEAKGRLTVDGVEFKWKKELDDDDWSHAKDTLDIKAGPAHVHGTPEKLRLDAKSGGKSAECTFTPIADAWRPGNGKIRFGKDKKTADFTVFPLMKVVCEYDFGAGKQSVEGRGWGTRSWSDIAVYEQARWTLQLRVIAGDYTVYIRELGASADFGRKRIPYLLVTKGNQVLVESFDYDFKATGVFTDDKHKNRYAVPESFQIVGKDRGDATRQFRGAVTKKKLRARKDLLKSMNAAVRMVAKRYSEPVRYDYDTDVTLQVKIGDTVEEISGVGRYEVYHWNK